MNELFDTARRPTSAHDATLGRFGSGTGWAERAEAGPKLEVLRIATTDQFDSYTYGAICKDRYMSVADVLEAVSE